MQHSISRNTFLFIFGATLALGSASAGWTWKPVPTQMMGGMYQATGMGAVRPNPMMGRTYQNPRMGGMHPASMMGGMYQPPTMGGVQGFINTNQQGMYSGSSFKIIQETWTPPVD